MAAKIVVVPYGKVGKDDKTVGYYYINEVSMENTCGSVLATVSHVIPLEQVLHIAKILAGDMPIEVNEDFYRDFH